MSQASASGKTTPLVIKVTGFVIVVAIVAAIGGLLFGFDTGVISGAILFITAQFHLSSVEEEVTTSAVLIGAIVGAIVGGVFADRIGRRRSIIAAAGTFIVGTAIAAIAGDIFVLWIGRIVVGMAIGVASFVVPMYIAELAPPQTRGLMTSLNQVAVTVGILLAYGIDYIYSASSNWRAMFAWGLVPGAVLLVGMFFMPYSPRWLLSKGREQDASTALTKIRGAADVQAEVKETEAEIQAESAGGTGVKGLQLVETPALHMPLLIGMGLAVLQQVTGINTVIYYAPTIFKNAGFSSASASIGATAGVGAVNLLFTVFAAFLVDRVGRRPLLLISLAGMIVGLVALGLGFLFAGSSGGALGTITVISLMIYIASFAIGMGPIFWLLISEIYPLNARGTAMSLATVANWAANFLVAVTFLSLVNLITQGGTFLLYAAIGVGAWIFTFRLVPETKGKTLEQIQAHWQSGKHPREMGGTAAPKSPTMPEMPTGAPGGEAPAAS
jgi:sugar porter (SP) family MFS transporter